LSKFNHTYAGTGITVPLVPQCLHHVGFTSEDMHVAVQFTYPRYVAYV